MPYLLEDDELWFPELEEADDEGLLMVGGDLSPERLLLAYRRGIFPWFIDHGLPFWFAPNPRLVIFPDKVNVSKSMSKVLRSGQFHITFNQAFHEVIRQCAQVPRSDQSGTWISDEFIIGYTQLHHLGHAHSVEVWDGDKLVGGLYGVETNGVFSGESMFSLVANASKTALIWLCQSNKYKLIDCQVGTAHLQRMGAEHISRADFVQWLKQ